MPRKKRVPYKLNKPLVDCLLQELESFSKLRLLNKGAIRCVCHKVGISHTTFYRWLREYRCLVSKKKQRHRGQEKILFDFGRAAERLLWQARCAAEKEVSASDLFEIETIIAAERAHLRDAFMNSEEMSTNFSDKIEKIEALSSYLEVKYAYQDAVYDEVSKRRGLVFCSDAINERVKKSAEVETDWEALTDQVTGGVGYVEFVEEKTRKDV